MKSIVLAGIAATLAFSAATADAATIYTDRASFLAAISGAVTDTFEQNLGGGYTLYPTSYFGAGFTVSGTDESLGVTGPGYNQFYQWNSGDTLGGRFDPGTITTSASALGFDFASWGPDRGFKVVTINGVDYTTGNQPTFMFFGITDIGPIGSISIDYHDEVAVFDNLTIGSTGASAAVPEPASWALMIAGFGLVGGALRRRRLALA